MSIESTSRSTEIEDPSAPAEPAPARRRRSLSRLILPLLLVAIAIVFSVMPATAVSFPTAANINAIVSSNSVLVIVAIALVFPMVCGQFDLSIGANLGLSAIATAALFSEGMPTVVAILGGVLVTTLIGAVNGVIVARLGVSSFITTLGMTTIIAGGVLAYTSGQSILDGIPASVTGFASGRLLGLPQMALVVLIVGVAAWYVLAYTPVGRSMKAVGSNPSAARLVGLNVPRLTFLSFVASGALAGIGGVLMMALSSGANPQAGPGYLLPAFAAVFLGTTVSRTSGFNVGGTVIAVLFVSVSVSGLVLAGIEPWVEQVFQGVVLILAVTLSTLTRRKTEGTAI